MNEPKIEVLRMTLAEVRYKERPNGHLDPHTYRSTLAVSINGSVFSAVWEEDYWLIETAIGRSTARDAISDLHKRSLLFAVEAELRNLLHKAVERYEAEHAPTAEEQQGAEDLAAVVIHKLRRGKYGKPRGQR